MTDRYKKVTTLSATSALNLMSRRMRWVCFATSATTQRAIKDLRNMKKVAAKKRKIFVYSASILVFIHTWRDEHSPVGASHAL